MQKGFLSSLFDVSFSSFVTTKIVKFVYVVTLVLIALVALLFVIAAFKQNAGVGALVLFVVAPLISLVYVVYTRVFLEFIVQVFRVSETLRDQTEMQRTAFANAGWLPATAPVEAPVASAWTAPGSKPEAPVVSSVSPVAREATPANVVCSNCGATSDAGTQFCRSCGHGLSA